MSTENKSVAELAAETKAAFETQINSVRAIAEEMKGKLESGEAVTEALKLKADEALTGMNTLKVELDELGQKMALRGNDNQETKSLGQIVTDDEGIKSLMQTGRGRANVNVKAIVSALTTDADGSAGDLIVPQRLGMVDLVARRRPTVRDLITPGRTSSNSIQYPTLKTFTNNAATVTETAGTAKAQSEIKFDIVTGNVTTIAHWIPATKQVLADAPMLQSIINEILMYGLKYAEDNQLLNGGGTGTDLNGIYTQATAFSAPITPSEAGNLTKVDIIRLAMLQASLAELPASGIVLHPSDWADIELTKTSDGAYLFANPQGTVDSRLWGLPVVTTQAMTIDKFLVGAFKGGAQVFDREDANIEISTEHDDYFTRNLVAIRCEERLALAVYNALAFTKGDFSDSLAA